MEYETGPPDEFAILIGTTISDGSPGPGAGNIETPGSKDVYTFTAQPGQVVSFQQQEDDSALVAA